jgi:lysozyme family protein
MSDFDPAVRVVLLHEGGWVDDVADPGKETNFGISSLIIAREALSGLDLGIDPSTPMPTLDANGHVNFYQPGYLKPMTVDTAKALYRRLFWERFGYSAITEQLPATKVFDCAVNCGPPRAHTFAQSALLRLGHQVKRDGIMGAETIGGINACEPLAFVAAFAGEMRAYYESLISTRPNLSVFENNWLKRARWGVDSQPSPAT